MKKLSLKPNAFDKGEVLTRAQLRKVMGGAMLVTGGPCRANGDACNQGVQCCSNNCSSDSSSSTGKKCTV